MDLRFLVLATAVIAAPVQADNFTCTADGIGSASRPVVECVTAEARRLEPSKEPARDVAIAAASVCNPLFSAFRLAMQSCSAGDFEYVRHAETKLAEIARTIAIREVVKLRASRP